MKLETEDFSLSNKILDVVFESLAYPNCIKLPLPLTKKNKEFKKKKHGKPPVPMEDVAKMS